ncbi:carboxypeptidase-like regulatory domain-containing protein [Chitinophaga pendula]|uniref:hypothetical protein n=1 Tax=Chitinophaga TaxID=79328 RepID=UPI0012FE586A|nr:MULTISPECIES: hypothetical protein [Chitinophaga]UCJ07581.1 carboxypeptidase-like regulatory domain-containing protein [Chitinophaga pendula]
MKALFCSLLLLLSVTVARSQSASTLVFKGQLQAAHAKTPVPYASLNLRQHSSAGAVSNNEGLFELHLDASQMSDTIVITSVGFRNYLLPVKKIDFSAFNRITLEDTVYVLNEVLVGNRSPKEMIVSAMSKVADNFYNAPCEMDCFYRFSIKEDGAYVKLNEADIKAYDPGFNQTRGVVLDYRQLRKSDDPRAIKPNPIVPPTELFHSYNLIRDKKRIMDYISKDYWDYELKKVTSQDGKMIYVVNANVKPEVNDFALDAVFYIQPPNNKIVRIDYDGDKKLDKFPASMSGGGRMGLRLESLKGTYVFDEENEKVFMKYLQVQISYEFYDRVSGDKLNEYYENSELTVYNRQLSFSSKPPSRSRYIEQVKMKYDPAFWKGYRYTEQIPRDKKLIPDMNAKTPLETQFTRSGK